MSKRKKSARKKKEASPEPNVRDRERCDPEDSEPDQRAMLAAVETGRDKLNEALKQHTSTGPELTGGDLDADWGSAVAVGDEAPGGHMPTPDQDAVEDIGRAVGLEFPLAAEVHTSGEVLSKRDRRRWELDPIPGEDLSKGSRRRRIEDIPFVMPLDEISETEDLEIEEEPKADEFED